MSAMNQIRTADSPLFVPDSTDEKILVILPHNLGDVIMASPVIEGIKRRFPTGHVSFLVEKGYEGGMVNNPHCDCLLTFPRKEIRQSLRPNLDNDGVRALAAIIDELNSKKFDRVVNLSQNPYVSYIAALIKAPAYCGQRFLHEGSHAIYDRWSQYLYAIPFARHYNTLHAVDVYRRIAKAKAHCGGYTIALTEDERRWAQSFLQTKGFGPLGKIAMLQPGAAYPSKRWPVEHFAKLGEFLLDDGWQVLITGSDADRERAQGVFSLLNGDIYNAAGETTFRESICLLSCVHACVSSDTAIMHAASAMRIPVYALFGPTSPVETGPYGHGNWVFAGRCPNRPCFCRECKTHLCMKSISPKSVYAIMKSEGGSISRSCDVFRTHLAPSGDYSMQPFCADGSSYINETGAMMTVKLFDRSYPIRYLEKDASSVHISEIEYVLRTLTEMRRALSTFLQTHDRLYISRFEHQKDNLAKLRGVGAFMTAIVNIRLNSIPMIDVAGAIEQSIRECVGTEMQISDMLASLSGRIL